MLCVGGFLRCTGPSFAREDASFNMRFTLAVGILLIGCCSKDSVAWRPEEDDLVEEIDANGALGLVIRAFLDNIIHDIRELQNEKLYKQIVDTLRIPFSEIRQYVIGHPALQEKRLWVGRNKPTFDPSESELKYGTVSKSTKQRRHLAIPDEVCRTERHWELINQTVDMNGKKVEIIQSDDYYQYVFVYKCQFPRSSCTGINNYYNSECEMRQGWVMLYHRLLEDPEAEAKWDFVAIPHHCACKITAKRPYKL